MSIDLPVTLRLLSHELRTPVGVIQGYLKMLMDGRVEDQMRPKIITQIQRAAARVATIGQQASDLSHWVADAPRTVQEVPLRTLVEAISGRALSSVRLTQATATDCADRTILTLDPSALVDAGFALVEAVVKAYGNDAILSVSTAEDMPGCDLVVSAVLPGHSGDEPAPVAERSSIAFDEAGVGLSMLIAAAVVSAHGGRLWHHPGHARFGMTLPWSHKP